MVIMAICRVPRLYLSLWARTLTFLDGTLKREFKSLALKTCFFSGSVSLFDSLLHCECNSMKEIKAKRKEIKIHLEEEGATCHVEDV
jgi:hypothetical protein